jgi:hypothetical protein
MDGWIISHKQELAKIGSWQDIPFILTIQYALGTAPPHTRDTLK